jgi:hypothetical protein
MQGSALYRVIGNNAFIVGQLSAINKINNIWEDVNINSSWPIIQELFKTQTNEK